MISETYQNMCKLLMGLHFIIISGEKKSKRINDILDKMTELWDSLSIGERRMVVYVADGLMRAENCLGIKRDTFILPPGPGEVLSKEETDRLFPRR